MKNKRLEFLLQSYLDKTITSAGEAELFELLGSNMSDEQVRSFMEKIWQEENFENELSEEQSRRILSSVFGQDQSPVIPLRQNRFRKQVLLRIAAVGIIAIGVLSFYLLKDRSADNLAIAKPSGSHQNDVAPGSTGAILKLADGSSIILDNAGDGQLAMQEKMRVIKEGGTIKYIGNNEGISEASYNVIETPRGRQYQLSLEDGTKVWLNAASSIRFPVAFADTERKVEISGEVYFEVAKNKDKPFRVNVRGTTVEVLGTHFNVNSYADEESINTTLLEGSVKVIKGSQQNVIRPGQQAQVDENGSMKIGQNVNLTEVMAWKENLFSFNHTDIRKLMRQLSRWYDVEVVFENENQEPVAFIGGISRTVNLSTVLDMLEQTGEVKFEIRGKKIVVRS